MPMLIALWCSLANVPAPSAKSLHNFGRDGSGEGYSDEDEALVDGIRQGELSPYTY